MIAVALMGGLLTVRTRDDIASANAFDRKAMIWVTAYGKRITPVLATLNSMLPDEVHGNLPGLLVKCQRRSTRLCPWSPLPPAFTFLPPQLGSDVRGTLDHLRRGLEDGVVAEGGRTSPFSVVAHRPVSCRSRRFRANLGILDRKVACTIGRVVQESGVVDGDDVVLEVGMQNVASLGGHCFADP